MISKRKKEYYDQLSKKLNDPLTSSKTYRSILKTFYSGTKIPLIPPIIIDNKVIKNFREKTNATQYMSNVNDSIYYHPQLCTEQKIGFQQLVSKMKTL